MDGVVLQVHHKVYFAGRLPWQYRYDQCEALCKGCHAEEHGLIFPRTGWEALGHSDLGGLDGECELCQTALRYVFLVHHATWGTMEVGEICCDKLTSTSVATTHMKAMHRTIERRKRFVSSSRWGVTKSGALRIFQNHVLIWVVQDGASYRLHMNGKPGKLVFKTVLDAKAKAFDLVESGVVSTYLANVKRRRG
jgi:hypothetical protein